MNKLRVTAAILTMTVGACVFADEDRDDNQGEISDSTLPKVSITASDPVAFRGLSTGAFLVSRNSTNDDLNVKLAISGSASNGVDYATLPSSVTIPAGFFTVGLQVSPIGGGAAAPSRRVTLTIEPDDAYRRAHSAQATVQIKANILEDQAPTVSITAPADNSSILARTDLAITAEAQDPNDSIAKVSFYANDRFLGTVKTSPYSLTWSNVPAGNFSLFARAEDQFGKSTLSAPVRITATNPPPATTMVVLSAPTTGSSFPPGANITLEATVTGAAPVKSVSFYSGDTLLGTDDTAPYSFTWNNVAPGHYTLRAKATEVAGGVASSPSVKITVSNAAPKISITSPTNNAAIAGPSDITVTADATDPDGAVSKVTFFGDSKVIGSTGTAPYSITWTNVAPGKHIILATATDAFGAFSSSAVLITVTNPAPTVSITAPANGDSLTAPAAIEIKADAADADGIAYVSFWSGEKRLGEDKDAPYSFNVSNLAAGTYTLRAHAVDTFGQRTISEPVKITVK